MSLEQTLAENTAAIRELIEALRNPGVPNTIKGAPSSPKGEKAEARAATQPATATATTTPKASAKAETAAESPSDPKPEPVATTSSPKPSASVDYPTLQKAVFALAGKSRDAAAAVAGSFGVKTFKELPEAKWGDALAAVSDKLAELEAA